MHALTTEATRRALARAAAIAAACSAPAAEPPHLLWALVLDDSEAAEFLARYDVTAARLVQSCPLPLPLHALQSNNSSPAAHHYPDTPEFRRVMFAAGQAAAQRGTPVEIGTGDLLVGLNTVESAASRALAELNVCFEGAGPPSEATPAPIDVDFQIDWQQATATDQTATLRILDAAANRAREGLRVLEDYARFALDDAHLTRRLKECRHALREALAELPLEQLLRARETQSDVGTTISTQSETVRQSPQEVAWAGFKRAQEAIRSLEEFSKLISSTAAAQLEQLRYELYTLEKGFSLTQINRRALEGRNLYLLATEAQCPHGLGPAIRAALAGGVNVVQLREKDMPERRLLEVGRRIRAWTCETGALFIMNDRADLAVAVDADGVHVGQDELPVKEVRAIVGPQRLVGVSTHTLEQARQAVLDGADYLGVGPVFASATKSFESLAGLDLVRQVAAEISLPWFAIGGINADNIAAVVEAGARRIAVSHAILSAEDPEKATRTLRERLQAGD
jgi:thiamine-phosphate pyrophosphorylase